MRLMILRHGKAEERSLSGRDEDRALALRGDDGQEESGGHAQIRYLSELVWKAEEEPFAMRPERICSSRARRADETAQIVADALRLPVEHAQELSLDQPLGEFMDLLRVLDRQGIACALLVGHNPQVSEVVAHLSNLARRHGAVDAREGMRTGEMVVVEVVFGMQGKAWDNDDVEVTMIGRVRLGG